MSATAKRLMDSFFRESPQYTRGLRADTFMLEAGRTREFERAMAELQQGLWIVKTEERYEPSFPTAGPHRALAARCRRRVAGARPPPLDRVIARYLDGAVYSTPIRMARLFGLETVETARTVDRLARAGRVRAGVSVNGWPGTWVVRA